MEETNTNETNWSIIKKVLSNKKNVNDMNEASIYDIAVFCHNRFKTTNMQKPSAKASYNCDGCLGKYPPLGNLTAHGTVVTLPQSSSLIKFAILPKKRPIGANNAAKSVNNQKFIFLEYAAYHKPKTAPTAPP